MTAALLNAAQADGLSLFLEQGKLRARGPGQALERWTPAIRECKAALVALLSAPATDPAPTPDPDPPRRHWLIQLPTGEVFDSTFTPPATRAEVLGWYPGATVEEVTG